MIPLVDMHCHLFAEMDDGPRSWDDALTMCRIAHEEGTQLVAATAHQEWIGRKQGSGVGLSRLAVVARDLIANPIVFSVITGTLWRQTALGLPGPLDALVRFEVERAHQWFQRGMELAPLLDRRSAACLRAMAGIYRRLLNRIQAHPDRALAERMSLPVSEKLWVAASSMLGGSG